MLTSRPLFLHYAVDNEPLILTTDASGIGIDGVLHQEIDGTIHNLYYHSQVMTPCERRYSTIEKEALAIYKCVERMRPYLLGRDIILLTDHCPLCGIISKTIKNTRVDRIANLIQEYNIIQVIHIKGRENCLPDYLSRFPRGFTDDLSDIEYGLEQKQPSPELTKHPVSLEPNQSLPLQHPQTHTVSAMILRSHTRMSPLTNNSPSMDTKILDNEQQQLPSEHESSSSSQETFSSNHFDITKLIQEQNTDSDIQRTLSHLRRNPLNSSFVLRDAILYRLINPSKSHTTKVQAVHLPSSMIQSLLSACHDDPMIGSHFSLDRTYDKMKLHYWWPGMKHSIKKHIQSCLRCQQFNISRQKRPGLLRLNPPPDGPFLLIGIDYCGPFKRTPRNNQHVLVITDYFSRHTIAIALPNCTAETTAQALFNEYFCKYGIPTTIISDQGPHFQNILMNNIQKLIGYQHIYSTPYHPQTNGIVERFNGTFIPQISKLQDSETNNWDEYLQAVVFAYNSGTHKTTQYSPYELLYGRPPRLPIHPRPSHFSFVKPNDYFEQLKKTLRLYHQTARNNIVHQRQLNKHRYDINRQDPHYNVGDKVLSRLFGLRGKLDAKFSSSIKIVVKDIHPVYIVEDEVTKVQSRIHVSDLRPIYIA